eukprot:gene39680-53643_t
MMLTDQFSLLIFVTILVLNSSLLTTTTTKTLNLCTQGKECSNEVELRQAPRSCRSNFGLFFKQKGDDSKDEGENPGILSSIWKGIKRFVPDVTKAKIEKSYEVPQTEGGYRYHIRLVGSNVNNRRHVITRILRYFPDIKWETAADIVDTAIFDGKALVRVLNSL